MARFVQIAMGSGSELSCHSLLARDLGMLEGPEYRVPQESATEVLLMLSALSERVKRPAAREHLELTAKG
jgi:four helix bundle protein